MACRVGRDDPACFFRLFARRGGAAAIRFRARRGRAAPADPPVIETPAAPH